MIYPMKNTCLLLIGGLLLATPVLPASLPSPAILHALHKAPSQLPNMPLLTTEGAQVNPQSLSGKVVLVLFQPDCDHCQREAEAIHQHLEKFDDYSIYFITYAPMADIQQFARDYQLSGLDNVVFTLSEVQPILDNFGSIPTPSLYIYSDQQQLVKAFEGETPIDKVLAYL